MIPGRNYPLAILISAIITVLIFVLGTLAIGFIIPNSQINLVQSLLISYDSYFSFFGLGWMNWILALALAVGVLAQVTAWVGGPSKGLYQVGLAGNLPPSCRSGTRTTSRWVSCSFRAASSPCFPSCS